MKPILENLPDSSALSGEFSRLCGSLNGLSQKASGLSLAGLSALLESGGSLSVPNAFSLVSETVGKLDQMRQLLPSDSASLTVAVKKGLETLANSMEGVKDLLQPLSTVTDFLTPLVRQFDLVKQSVTRINDILSALPRKTDGLNLANLPDQFAYVSRIFTIFPEIAERSPFKELKSQIETIGAWVSLSPDDLTRYFRDGILTLAEALPVRLDEVLNAAGSRMAAVEAGLPSLDRNVWREPFQSALDSFSTMDLGDAAALIAGGPAIDDMATRALAAAESFGRTSGQVAAALDALDAGMLAQDLHGALMTIIGVVSPEKQGIIAVIFQKVRAVLGALNVSSIEKIIRRIDGEIDSLFGKMKPAEITAQIQGVTDRVVGAVGIVDRAMTTLAGTLSGLVAGLRQLIAGVDLRGLLEGVSGAVSQLGDAVSSLRASVDGIESEITAFIDEICGDIGELDVDAIVQSLQAFFSQAAAVLDDPQLRQILDDAREGMDGIAQELDAVSLKPLFDRVVEETGDLKEKLAGVDVSGLNEILKAALKIGLEIIRAVDFPSKVEPVLRNAFQDILNRSTSLIEPIQRKCKEIVGRITDFSPGAMVAERVTPLFQRLVGELKKIEPGAILAPLAALRDRLVGLTKPLSPQRVLAPLIELHAQLRTALRSLSPGDLITPLNGLLHRVTGLLDEIGIEEFVRTVSESVGKITDLFSGFSLADQLRGSDAWKALAGLGSQGAEKIYGLESDLDRFLDCVVSKIPAVDISVLQPAFDALRDAVASIERCENRPAFLASADAAADFLRAQDLEGGLAELTKRWRDQKARFEAAVPAAGATAEFEAMKRRLKDMSPIVLFAGPSAVWRRLLSGLDEARGTLEEAALSMKRLISENRAVFNGLLPVSPDPAAFAQLLRETLDDQLGKPIREILSEVKARFGELGGAAEKIKVVAQKLGEPMKALNALPESINRIGAALIDAKNKIVAINLDFLRDELQGVLDEVCAKLDELDPAALVNRLEDVFQVLQEAIAGLFPEGAIRRLNTAYTTSVLEKVEALNPDVTIAQPLDEVYQHILEALESLNVDTIFDALNGKLSGLGRELDEGLKRSGATFQELLTALPL